MEFDLFNNPHSHPLIFYRQGRLDGNYQNQNVCCSKCHQPWYPPSLSCSDCSFLIHQSCLDLPPKIGTPFHPHHKRSLVLTTNNDSCNCCGQLPYDSVYRCPECSFQIDVQCAIVVDTKAKGIRQTSESGTFRHFSHPHPLTLKEEQQYWGKRKVFCFLCERHIESGSTYFCSLCNFYIHAHCAEMPREIQNLDYHHHPLFLFALPWEENTLCDNCKDECNRFFYGCAQCDFSLHLHCLSSFKHKHNFKHFKNLLHYTCQVCGTHSENRVVDWCCSECNLLAHGECTELPSSLQISQHPHSLELTYGLDLAYNICKICGLRIKKSHARYFCRYCNYFVHWNCAKNIQIQTTESKEEGRNYSMSSTEAAVDPIPYNNHFNLENGILHFSHEHKLTLCPFEDNKHCNGCMQCIISTPFYGCPPCGFYLHEQCARLPRQHMTSFHLHELSMVNIPDFVFSCAVCLQFCHGFAYHCEECHYTIDIRCAVLVVPLTHPSHNHPLSHFRIKKGYGRCAGCRGWLQNKVGCVRCRFYLDFKCAHLPLAVRNRFDEHPLSLTCVNDEDEYYCGIYENEGCENDEDEYYCDICEEEREEDEWFYSCKQCCFAAHINCVLGEYPFLKSAQFEGHQHPLTLVGEGKKGYSACGSCGYSCESNLAFECEDLSCKFNVHAFGNCYHNQLTQGRITFTMPSLRYRSVPLYLDPIQREGSTFILLGRHEGSTWNERNMLASKQSVVNHKYSNEFQIQYEKNEKSFWSTKHGEDGDSKSKVNVIFAQKHHEDVGRKVTMSLGQHYGLGGRKWEDKKVSSIKRVVITHDGHCIVSIQTEFIDDNGTPFWSGRHGANGGQKVEVELEHPDEYLISIHGCMTHIQTNHVVGTLTLESNKRIFGPFGDKGSKGLRFWFPSCGAKIVGFHGRSGYYLDSIGIKVIPIHNHNHGS